MMYFIAVVTSLSLLVEFLLLVRTSTLVDAVDEISSALDAAAAQLEAHNVAAVHDLNRRLELLQSQKFSSMTNQKGDRK